MFGINIDPQQMQQLQYNIQMCAQHPGCEGCELYTLQGLNGTICENAVVRLSAQTEQSEQTSS